MIGRVTAPYFEQGTFNGAERITTRSVSFPADDTSGDHCCYAGQIDIRRSTRPCYKSFTPLDASQRGSQNEHSGECLSSPSVCRNISTQGGTINNCGYHSSTASGGKKAPRHTKTIRNKKNVGPKHIQQQTIDFTTYQGLSNPTPTSARPDTKPSPLPPHRAKPNQTVGNTGNTKKRKNKHCRQHVVTDAPRGTRGCAFSQTPSPPRGSLSASACVKPSTIAPQASVGRRRGRRRKN